MHLTPQQEQGLALISAGSTISSAAESAGVHRNTVHNWVRFAHQFRLALSCAREAKSVHWREQAEELAATALDTIRSLMTDSAVPAAVRLKAALSIVNIATVPPLESRPAFLPPEIVHNSAQPIPEVPQPQQLPVVHQPEPSPEPEPVHNPAQPPDAPAPQSIRHDASKTGRKDPCPCGSGKKFKRCCLDKPASTWEAA